MLRRLSAVCSVLLLLLTTVSAASLLLKPTGDDMTRAANRFVASLTPEQKEKAALGFDSELRTKWHFIPLAERKGLQIKEMTDVQRTEALALLKACVSEVGYHKAHVIMGLEAILRELEKTRTDGPIRDPERYYWTVYGEPAPTGKWGLSIEGHHLSLNFTVSDGELASFTPSFFGANPAIVHNHLESMAPKGTRILDKEEVLAFELLGSLDDEQRKLAVIAEKAPADIRAAGEVQPPQTAPEGLPGDKLNDEQKKTLENLLSAYLGNMPLASAEKRKAEVLEAGLDKAWFAWAGADKPGIGHYYRIQGPTYLVEFVNVQPDAAGNPANHIHAAWRDLRGDFDIPVK